MAALLAAIAPTGAGANPADEGRSMVDELNRVRVAHGLGALRRAPVLERSSGAYAKRLIDTNVFAHANRILTPARFRTLGEVLELHTGTRPLYRGAVRRWLASPSHRVLILSGAFRWAGAGRDSGRFAGRRSTIWVVQLGG